MFSWFVFSCYLLLLWGLLVVFSGGFDVCGCCVVRRLGLMGVGLLVYCFDSLCCFLVGFIKAGDCGFVVQGSCVCGCVGVGAPVFGGFFLSWVFGCNFLGVVGCAGSTGCGIVRLGACFVGDFEACRGLGVQGLSLCLWGWLPGFVAKSCVW